MNIHDLPKQIKSSIGIQGEGGTDTSEELEFDDQGHVVSQSLWSKLFLSLIITMVATLSFGLGRLSVVSSRVPMKLEFDPSLVEYSGSKGPIGAANTASVIQSLPNTPTRQGEVVASSKGTKYHYPHCSGAKQISEKNLITFTSPAQAEAAGYTLAANCKPR